MQRVRLRFHLGPLDRSDTRNYIEHRLAVAGRGDGDIFTDDTFEVIYRYSGGVPRLINTLCDSSLLVAFADEKHEINAEDIQNTADELGWTEHEDSTGEHEVVPRLVKDKKPDTQYLMRVELRRDGKVIAEHLFEAGRVVIGRAPDNEIHVESQFVSRHHAQLTVNESGCAVEDLNSTNGVFIGKNQVKKQLLEDGDVISLGTHDLVYHDLRQDENKKESTAVNDTKK